jgi:hypothetical protein
VQYNQDFVQMFSSSEAEPTVLSAGLSPSYLHRAVTHGEVVSVHPPKQTPTGPSGFGAISNHYN